MASCNGLVWPWVMVRSAITISCGLIQYSLIAECCNIMMVLILNVPDLAQSSFTVYAASADLRVAEPTAIGLAVGTTSVRRSTASGRGFAPHAVASSARCAAGYISEQESHTSPLVLSPLATGLLGVVPCYRCRAGATGLLLR